MGRGQKSIISAKSGRKELPLKGVKVTLMKEMARGDPGISAETAASSKKNNAWMEHFDAVLCRHNLLLQQLV